MRNEFWSTCGALQSFGLFFFFDAIIGDAIIDVIIGTKVEQKLFFEQFESGSDFVLKRNARKPRKYVTPHIQHAPPYPTREKVSFTYFFESKFISSARIP